MATLRGAFMATGRHPLTFHVGRAIPSCCGPSTLSVTAGPWRQEEFASRGNELNEGRELRRNATIVARGKGFGELLQRGKRDGGKGKREGGEAVVRPCPCGGGEERKPAGECCGRFHGGVIEPDALTLMKARFAAYSLGVVPYVVRTTHPQNPDFEGAEKLAADVRATCERLRFFKLDILQFEELSETEAIVRFIVTYSILNGVRGEKKELEEKSRFIKENGRWYYREGTPLNRTSEAAWMSST